MILIRVQLVLGSKKSVSHLYRFFYVFSSCRYILCRLLSTYICTILGGTIIDHYVYFSWLNCQNTCHLRESSKDLSKLVKSGFCEILKTI